ncbi:MAG: DUF5658 family protein [Candidatus Diapherotrites archaeon]
MNFISVCKPFSQWFSHSVVALATTNTLDAITTFVIVEFCHLPELNPDFAGLLETAGSFAYLIKLFAFTAFPILLWFALRNFRNKNIVYFKAMVAIGLFAGAAWFLYATVGNFINLYNCVP